MKLFNIIKRNRKRDYESIQSEMNQKGFFQIKGELEVSGFKNGEQIYYDLGDNTVTIYAKHATMHLLTGEAFTSHGEQRSFDETSDHTATGVGEGTNSDETLISGQQYFSDNTSPDYSIDDRWTKNTLVPSTTLGDAVDTVVDSVKYPFFPTKMLFGTGFEFTSWSSLGTNYPEYQQAYIDLGWDQSTFDTNISLSANDYSNIWTGSSLTQARSMNDVYTGKLLTPVITDTDFGISGAIKGGTYNISSSERLVKTEEPSGDEFLIKAYQGVGRPSFIYARRESRFFQSGSEILLTADSTVENKITYTTVMPEQTASSGADGIFYPYNGYTIKVAGLFCDANLVLANTVPAGNYQMPYGMMFSKRYISPITKDHTTSITSRWTLYL